jgi:hypothetical protein
MNTEQMNEVLITLEQMCLVMEDMSLTLRQIDNRLITISKINAK